MSNFSRRLKSMFSSRKKIWSQFAHEINAEYVDHGLFKSPQLIKKLENTTIIMDYFGKNRGKNKVYFTRFVTSCTNPKMIHFRVDRKTLLNKRAPKGLEQLPTEHRDFDRLFRLFVSNRRQVSHILKRKILDDIAGQQPYRDLHIELINNQLSLWISPINKDLVQLRSLYQLIKRIRTQIESQE
jgi:hypothetical protein